MNELDHLNGISVTLLTHIKNAGGVPYITGGSVRDHLLGITTRDLDVVVVGMDKHQLHHALSAFGQVLVYGKSFQVYQIRGISIEFSLPRNGGKEETEPQASLRHDAHGRDFSVNALYQCPFTGDVIDPLGGCRDLQDKRLRMASEKAFEDDPLRMLRGVQLCSRLGFILEEATEQKMKESTLQGVAPERIYEELNKWLLSPYPETGWDIMVKTCLAQDLLGRLGQREMTAESTHQVIKETLCRASSCKQEASNPLLFMWSCFLAAVTQQNTGMAEAFYALSRHADHTAYAVTMLWGKARLMTYSWRKADVCRLSLGVNLADVCLMSQCLMAYWKVRGCSGDMKLALQRIRRMAPENPIRPFIKGRDLVQWGYQEGPIMGVVLEISLQLQLEGVEKEEIEKFVRQKAVLLQK